MTPLRIAMLTTFYPPYSFGGDALGVQRLSAALGRRGHDVTVVHDLDAYNALAPKRRPTTAPAQDGVRVISLHSPLGVTSTYLTHQLGYPVVQRRRLQKILDDGAFDVIWFHNISLLGGPGLLTQGDALKVYEAHEHWLICPTHTLWRHNRETCTARQCLRCVFHHRRPPQLWRYTNALPRKLRRIDAFIAKSEFSRSKHKEFGFSGDMDVVPYFLPEQEPTIHEVDRQPHERPYFLFVGRLERIKGLDEIIPAFQSYTDADLLVAGDGGYGDTLRRQSADIAGVKFLGHVAPDRLHRYYRDAIALIVPSVCFETFGIILIEAFRNGTPVIARHIGPFPEIIERCGGGALFSNQRQLVSMMKQMQHDTQYRDSLALAARAGFERQWSESVVIKQYLSTLQRAANRTGRRSLATALGTAQEME